MRRAAHGRGHRRRPRLHLGLRRHLLRRARWAPCCCCCCGVVPTAAAAAAAAAGRARARGGGRAATLAASSPCSPTPVPSQRLPSRHTHPPPSPILPANNTSPKIKIKQNKKQFQQFQQYTGGLGLGSSASVATPTAVPGFGPGSGRTCVALSCGGYHTLALTQEVRAAARRRRRAGLLRRAALPAAPPPAAVLTLRPPPPAPRAPFSRPFPLSPLRRAPRCFSPALQQQKSKQK